MPPLKKRLRLFFKVPIALFCLWHIVAVLAYALPHAAADPFSLWIRANVLPTVRPYMLSISQWQQWNLFAPDPLRRVTHYRIEWNDGSAWRELVTYKPGSFAWWQHAARFKVLDRLLESNGAKLPLQERFIHMISCEPYGLPLGTQIRLSSDFYVIPSDRRILSFNWWRNGWDPTMKTVHLFETYCPL